MSVTATKSWAALEAHRQSLAGTHLRELFQREPGRVASLSLNYDGMYYDFSKQRLTTETLSLLTDLAKEAGVAAGIQRMFAGERINNTDCWLICRCRYTTVLLSVGFKKVTWS